MNILVITKLFGEPDDAGADKPTLTVNYFVREWQAMGHQVVVMHTSSRFPLLLYVMPQPLKDIYAGRFSTNVPSNASRKPLVRSEAGAKVYRLPMLKLWPRTPYSERAMRREFNKICGKLEEVHFTPDLIVGHFANPAAELTAMLVKRYRVPSSVVFHQDAFPQNIAKYRLKEWVPAIGAVGARSRIEAEQLQAWLGLPRLPFVCYSGVPNDAAEMARADCSKQDFSGGIRYLYVGSFIKRKHLDTVILAFGKTAKEKDTLRIVGGGIENDAMRHLAAQTGREEQISFAGVVSRPEVLGEMKAAHVFTLVSNGEAFGMVYLEAMLQGCIVVATKGGAFDGIIQDGVNGFLCEAGNADMLAKVWEHIAALTASQRNAISRAAVQTALGYTEKAVARRYLHDILANQAKRAFELKADSGQSV